VTVLNDLLTYNPLHSLSIEVTTPSLPYLARRDHIWQKMRSGGA